MHGQWYMTRTAVVDGRFEIIEEPSLITGRWVRGWRMAEAIINANKRDTAKRGKRMYTGD